MVDGVWEGFTIEKQYIFLIYFLAYNLTISSRFCDFLVLGSKFLHLCRAYLDKKKVMKAHIVIVKASQNGFASKNNFKNPAIRRYICEFRIFLFKCFAVRKTIFFYPKYCLYFYQKKNCQLLFIDSLILGPLFSSAFVVEDWMLWLELLFKSIKTKMICATEYRPSQP